MTAIGSPTIHNFIGGKWLNSSGPAGIELYNPATGEFLGQTPTGSANDVDVRKPLSRRGAPLPPQTACNISSS
jgi:acyl-CoA reductase-like NAD-dependent aldehyde dehydrogenase